MKRIITIIIIAIVSVSSGAKEVAKNFQTGMSLDCTAGIYSLKSNQGIIVLGNLKDARNTIFQMDKSFTQEKLSEIFNTGEQKFSIDKDDDGMYIFKIGLGGMKIRPEDTAKFLIYLESQIVKNKGKKIWNTIKE